MPANGGEAGRIGGGEISIQRRARERGAFTSVCQAGEVPATMTRLPAPYHREQRCGSPVPHVR